MNTESFVIYIEHQKLIRLEELAVIIAQSMDSHCKIEINFNPEKTKAIVNVIQIDYQETKRDIQKGTIEEFKEIAIDIAKTSNTKIKIDFSFDTNKTQAKANILLLGVNK